MFQTISNKLLLAPFKNNRTKDLHVVNLKNFNFLLELAYLDNLLFHLELKAQFPLQNRKNNFKIKVNLEVGVIMEKCIQIINW